MTEKELDYSTPDNIKRTVWDKIFRLFNFYFYFKAISTICSAGTKIKKEQKNPYSVFVKHSGKILRIVESTGAKIEYSGLENIPDKPCVIVGNHFSTLETITLGRVINDHAKISFVIKESLMKYPYFKEILKSLECITVTRTNPVQDLKKILKDGTALLDKGVSIVIFPQHTRGKFDPSEFSSIACKLAKRAKVPIVPLALDTRLWGKGKLISDLGPVNRSIPVRYAFGEAMVIDKNEKEIHAKYLDFIGEKLKTWGAIPS
ncbi:MAG: 1-acyl-sn-glycerol-3-phosphate acyltransferase [Lentisphaeraceae bacterium]|nr:1-acyl-sn-glycerol-3-phosphate acyltransferase [Lentisphaeraceae bacterium]